MRCRWYSITGLLRQRQQHLQIQLSTCYINLNNMHHLRRCSNDTTRGNLHIWYQNGLPVLEVPLPSRREICQFTLKPIGDTVSRFCKNIECEDKGIEIVYVYSTSKFEYSKVYEFCDLLLSILLAAIFDFEIVLCCSYSLRFS
ncbi:hypothetical protein WUBG_18613 [Wuchereria bancrofti]|uniref:Uncharacterized protein n=1 Tax=Wuchereria bancrofti TaxID=6293 RepID=J9A934_WUCBA|nr:hypothetical protein WUBG_18613 [Wuchereria bancrofti]